MVCLCCCGEECDSSVCIQGEVSSAGLVPEEGEHEVFAAEMLLSFGGQCAAASLLTKMFP